MLAEIADLRVRPGVAFALLKFHHPGEDFQQRGFTCAVRTDEHSAFAAFDGQIESFIDFVRAVGHVDVVQRDGALSAARWLGNLEAERLLWRRWLLDQFQTLNLLELAHGLRRFGSHGTKTVNEWLRRL